MPSICFKNNPFPGKYLPRETRTHISYFTDSFFNTLLRLRIPSVPRRIVGIDVSPDMIDYCGQQYSVGKDTDKSATDANESEETIFSFEVADAGDPQTMKEAWRSKFDFLVSFLAMHWISDQRKILECIHFCLREGGIALLFFWCPSSTEPLFLSKSFLSL